MSVNGETTMGTANGFNTNTTSNATINIFDRNDRNDKNDGKDKHNRNDGNDRNDRNYGKDKNDRNDGKDRNNSGTLTSRTQQVHYYNSKHVEIEEDRKSNISIADDINNLNSTIKNNINKSYKHFRL